MIDVQIDIFRLLKEGPEGQDFGLFPVGGAGILRLTQDGKAVGGGLLGKKYPLNLYYAYGIRNGYGLDFDPVSGKLWDKDRRL